MRYDLGGDVGGDTVGVGEPNGTEEAGCEGESGEGGEVGQEFKDAVEQLRGKGCK